MPETLFEKVWNRHVVAGTEEATLLYIDRHLVHEVTSPQAFDGLRLAGRRVRRPDLTFATVDHNVPTDNQLDIRDPLSRRQVETLRANCPEFGITLYDIRSGHQGIVHVIGPELGLTLPGLTIVCGDSHTSTHGAFGALAFGIGTSEVEHVLATQTLWQGARPHSLGVEVTGQLRPGLEPKDIILAIIRKIGTGGATGHVIEYYGPAIAGLSMEGRMTICNMSIEAGARAGLIAPDDVTIEYIARGDRPFAPRGAALEAAIQDWRGLRTEDASAFDRHVAIDASALVPQVTWGTNPAMTVDVTGVVPGPEEVPFTAPEDARRALAYMGLAPGYADPRDPGRRRLHRVLHQWPDRGSPRRGPGLPRPEDGPRRPCPGRPRQRGGAPPGRSRGARPHLPRGRRRMAAVGVQHVPGHEPGQAHGRPAIRQHQQSQLRGPPGPRRTDPPRQPGHGRRRRRHRPLRGCPSTASVIASCDQRSVLTEH